MWIILAIVAAVLLLVVLATVPVQQESSSQFQVQTSPAGFLGCQENGAFDSFTAGDSIKFRWDTSPSADVEVGVLDLSSLTVISAEVGSSGSGSFHSYGDAIEFSVCNSGNQPVVVTFYIIDSYRAPLL